MTVCIHPKYSAMPLASGSLLAPNSARSQRSSSAIFVTVSPSRTYARARLGLLLGVVCGLGCSDSSDDDAANGGTGGGASGASAGSPAAGGGGAAAGSGGSNSAGSSGGMSNASLAGAFNLRLVPQMPGTSTTAASPAQTAFIGSVTDGPVPTPMSWVTAQEANGCTLYTPKSPFCDPGCGASAVCVTDDHCVDRPTAQSVGTIHLSGVGTDEVSMTPIAGNYQPKGGTMLPFPPCTEGSDVQVRAEGGAYDAFTLTAPCIAELKFDGPIEIKKATALKLSWNAPGKADLARIQVRVDISHHGGARGKIECDVDDTGALEIPAAMVDKLVELGVAGFPTVVVTRIATGGVNDGEPKQVKLNVQESIEREIVIDGLVSCTDSSQCTAPKTCQSDLTCR